jgi:hypothetical protein
VQGYAYYDAGIWFINQEPALRAEIWREGFEDYEYFFLANNNVKPKPNVNNVIDDVIQPVAQSIQAWTPEHSMYAAARIGIGRKLSSPSTVNWPRVKLNIVNPPSFNPIYLNFQDPAGAPFQNPLTVGGKTYKKVGWSTYASPPGYGFNPVSSQALYGSSTASGFNELQLSFVYDDYGQAFTFEVAVPSGTYKVTISVGYPGRAYPGDPHNVVIEGVKVVDNWVSTVANSVKLTTASITCTDGKLTFVCGGVSSVTGSAAYTFVQYIEIST